VDSQRTAHGTRALDRIGEGRMAVDVRGVQKSRFEAGAGMCCARGAAERIAARSNEMAGRIVCNGKRSGRAREEGLEGQEKN
jgi:hypothetical protein